MKSLMLMMSLIFALFAMTGCESSATTKPTSGAYQLTPAEVGAVNGASEKFFASKVMEANGKVYTGASLGCMGSDSDRDMNVTCTGNQPAMQGGAVFMQEREILCNYAGQTAVCKKKA